MYLIEHDLVNHLVTYYFGEVTSDIASLLLLRGPVSLSKLVNYTNHDFKLVRNVLVMLIQYGIVEYTLETHMVGNKSLTHVLYSLNPDDALALMLTPLLLSVLKDRVDADSFVILTHLAKFGISSPKKIKELNPGIEHRIVFESISKLYDGGYIRNVDTYEQHKSKHGEFFVSEGNFDVMENVINQRYTSSSGASYQLTDDQLFKINFDLIIQHMLKEEIKLLSYNRLGDSALIKSVVNILTDNNTGRWPYLIQYQSIQSELLSSPEFKSVAPNYLLKFFQGLSKHTDRLVVHNVQDDTYYFDWFKAKRMLKEKALFGSVKRMLGMKAARIWNLLIKEGEDNPSVTLDMHQISEMSLVSPQLTRSIMYSLSLKGLVKMHESVLASLIPKTQEQQPASQSSAPGERQVLFFSTSIDLTYVQVIKLGYKFASNLMERLIHENNTNFQRNLLSLGLNQDQGAKTDPNVVEIHLLNLIKFIMIMRQL